jgi:hypothetical protein
MKPKDSFIKLPRAVWDSPKFRALSSYAKVLLLAIQYGFNGYNNGQIRFSQARACRTLHCCERHARRAFNELKSAGLIIETERGCFNVKSGAGRASAWEITYVKNLPPKPRLAAINGINIQGSST